MCSKCKKSFPLDHFIKSERYSDGKYPTCRECRKEYRTRYLKQNPLCIRCKKEPHHATNPYCLECSRILQGGPPVRQRHHPKHPDLCPRCGGPRKHRRRWCSKCANAARKIWLKARGGQWAYAESKGNRHKLVARAYVNHLVQRRKLIPKPCEVCGRLEVEAHHNTYEDPLDIRWLCSEHHDALERWLFKKRKQLTASTMKE